MSTFWKVCFACFQLDKCRILLLHAFSAREVSPPPSCGPPSVICMFAKYCKEKKREGGMAYNFSHLFFEIKELEWNILRTYCLNYKQFSLLSSSQWEFSKLDAMFDRFWPTFLYTSKNSIILIFGVSV